MRVLNGIYLSNVKLGRTAEAEQAFGRVVALGIAYNELGVKFLFNPGSTDFWSDPKVSGPYAHVAAPDRQAKARTAKVCMDVVGHTSKTGSEAVNDALSLRRAATHPPAARRRVGRAGRPHQAAGHGLPPEHRRQRHRRRGRRARPARRVQDRPLPLNQAVTSSSMRARAAASASASACGPMARPSA